MGLRCTTPTAAAGPPLCHSGSQKTCGADPPFTKGGAWKKVKKQMHVFPQHAGDLHVISHGRISKIIALKKQKLMKGIF